MSAFRRKNASESPAASPVGDSAFSHEGGVGQPSEPSSVDADAGGSPVVETASDGNSPAARKSPVSVLLSVLIVMLFLIGAAVMLYPAANRLYHEYKNARITIDYDRAVEALDPEVVEKALAQARVYNEAHHENMIYDPFGEEEYLALVEQSEAGMSPTYDELLDVMGNGLMGYIEIRKIGQRIPIYHGTTVEALDRGIGHLHGTSLPVGGPGTHCVLSGHRGLPTAKLFTDLDQVERGDVFVVTVLGEHFAYEVYSIEIVKPERIDSLGIVPGEDLMTLVTCTPYGVNSHRMLVHGKRVDYVPDPVQSAVTQLALFSPGTIALALVSLCAVVVLFVVLVRRLRASGPTSE